MGPAGGDSGSPAPWVPLTPPIPLWRDGALAGQSNQSLEILRRVDRVFLLTNFFCVGYNMGKRIGWLEKNDVRGEVKEGDLCDSKEKWPL
jgi:hypothetical protein